MYFFRLALRQRFASQPYHVAAAVLFSAVAALLYGPYLTAMPEGFHVWAQADRLALALNFYDGGFDFWHPRTSSLAAGPLSSIGGVTGVEFPLQAYLAALSGLIFGRTAILPAFRTLDVTMAVVGFFYLFRIVFERTGSFVAGLLPGAFLLAAPTFAFYAGSTLPDPFSFSLTLVGYYYWLRYFEAGGRFTDLPMSFGILGLAALIKTTCVLHLLAVAGLTLLFTYANPSQLNLRQRLVLLATLGGSVAAVAGFFLHNLHLNETYRATIFLAAPVPIVPFETWHEFTRTFLGMWHYEYLSPSQYVVMGLSGFCCLALAWRSWQRFRPLLLLLLATLLISYVFCFLLGAQLSVHDYYIICSFMPPAVLLLTLALLLLGSLARPATWVRHALTLGLLGLSSYFTYRSFGKLAGRMSDNHPPASLYYTHRWLRGGAAQLRQVGVPTQARILVMGDGSPNISLVYFDRRGVTWQKYIPELTVAELEAHMSADSLQYVIMQPADYAQLAPQKDALLAAFEPVLTQPVSILRRRYPERQAW